MITLPEKNLAGNLAAFYITSASSASFTLILSMISSNVRLLVLSLESWTLTRIGFWLHEEVLCVCAQLYVFPINPE